MENDVELFEVRNSQGELCGFAVEEDGHFLALTTFLVPLQTLHTFDEAVDFIKTHGLAVLEKKWFAFIDDEWELVVIQEASTQTVTVSTDVFGGDGEYGFSHSFIAATDKLRLADPLTPLS
jgi:hypothetical protein